MTKLTKEAEAILMERFSRDCVIALATVCNDRPYVRSVNAFYENGAFYVLTYALSGKMQQLAVNPHAAIAGEWFTASGRGVNMGCFGKKENRHIAEKMRRIFAEWIGNGHTDLNDENTVILKIELTEGVLMSHGKRYEIDFSERETWKDPLPHR